MTDRTRVDYRFHARSRVPPSYAASASLSYDPLGSIAWQSVFWASDPSWTPPADGAAVSSWRNGGTAAANATQATGAAQPLYRASVPQFGDRPAIEFDATDDALQTATFTNVTVPYSFVVIGRLRATGATRVLLNGSAVAHRLLHCAATQWGLRAGGTAAFGGTTDTTVHFFRGNIITGNDTLFVDSTSTISGADVGATTMSKLTLGWDTGTVFGNCHLAFVGFYSGDISADAEFSNLKAWAKAFYQVQVS